MTGVQTCALPIYGCFSWTNSKGRKTQFQGKYDTKSERLKDDFCMLCWSLGIRTSITKSRGGYIIGLRTGDVKKNIDNFIIFQDSKKEALDKLSKTELKFDQTDYLPVTEKICNKFCSLFYDRYKETDNKKFLSSYTSWKNGKKKCRMCRRSIKKSFEEFPELINYFDQASELKNILDSGLTYDLVKGFEKQEGKKTMWDLTIPGSFTFLSADGVALFDTMSVHVPVSHKAKEEASKMLPSNMIFSPRDKSLFFTPSQGAILGLYNMSKPGGKNTGLKFQTIEEAIKNKHKISQWNDRITVGGIKAPLEIGRASCRERV